MKPGPTTNLHELRLANGVWRCVRPPDADSEALARLADAISARGERRPALLYWDARIDGLDEDAWLRFGRGGLDPIIASERDLSRCVAISDAAFGRLVSRGAIASEADFARAAALLSRSPGMDALWCEGLAGVIDLAAAGPLAFPRGPVAQAETLSLAVLVHNPDVSVEPFFAALKGQAITAQLDVLMLTSGFSSSALKAFTRQVDDAAAADPRLNKIRRYAFTGDLGPAYLANMAVGLAAADAVVLADARCTPVTPGAIQHLANWAISGDASSACPRILHDRRLVAAGLALARRGDEEVMTPWRDAVLSDGVRTVAAPAPWMVAIRRSAWLAANGMRGGSGPDLWTAELANGHSLRGRCILVGGEIAEWTGPERPVGPDAAVVVPGRPQPAAQSALRDPRAMEVVVETARAETVAREPAAFGFSDPFPSTAETRVLVFADAFGASQAIAFVEGLGRARAEGLIAVRVVGEAAFDDDGRGLDSSDATEIVERHVAETRPTVMVLSRLGHPAVSRAARAAAERLGAPVLFHIDDDLPNLPAVLGTDRYRLARHPRRAQALLAGMAQADLVLTATPALAERLRPELGHDRLRALTVGCASRRPPPRPAPLARTEVAIGYMGSAGHDHDLAMVVPALNRVLADYPFVRLVLFGSIAEQPSARRLEGRVERHGPISGDYAGFRRRLADLALDIGLAPLVDNAFNRVKTPTKWVEYAEAGAAVLASPIRPYRPIIDARAAFDARPDEWEARLRRLIEDPTLRRDLVTRADALLRDRFGWDKLEAEMTATLAILAKPGKRAA